MSYDIHLRGKVEINYPQDGSSLILLLEDDGTAVGTVVVFSDNVYQPGQELKVIITNELIG